MKQGNKVPNPIPVTIVTGFLGAGKTSLINELLRDEKLHETAVLINEFGEVQIDHDLVADFTDQTVITTTGCICCTASSDIKQSLYDLLQKRERGEIGNFRRVVVETTGLMDPVPVINSFLIPPTNEVIDNIVKTTFRLSTVVTLFDIIFGPITLEQEDEALKQVALADAIVLTKTDLARDPATIRDCEADKRQLALINPAARFLDRHNDWEEIRDIVLFPASYNLHGKSENVIEWLELEKHKNGHKHEHEEHINMDINRHGKDIRSHVIVFEQLIFQSELNKFLRFITEKYGTNILRIKGIVGIKDNPHTPVIIHGIQHTVYPVETLGKWPSRDKRTKIVIIGRNLDPDLLTNELRAQIACHTA